MAFQVRGTGAGFYITVSVMDGQGDLSQLRYALQSADYASALTDALAVVAGVDAMTAGQVVTYTISQYRDEDTVTFNANTDVSQRATLTFQIAGGVKKASLQIPAPDPAIFQSPSGPGQNIVDSTSAGIAAFAPLFQAGGECYISDGEVSAFFLRGKRTTR